MSCTFTMGLKPNARAVQVNSLTGRVEVKPVQEKNMNASFFWN